MNAAREILCPDASLDLADSDSVIRAWYILNPNIDFVNLGKDHTVTIHSRYKLDKASTGQLGAGPDKRG
jgi:hypothetical protein